jgi:hypothetical protein
MVRHRDDRRFAGPAVSHRAGERVRERSPRECHFLVPLDPAGLNQVRSDRDRGHDTTPMGWGEARCVASEIWVASELFRAAA